MRQIYFVEMERRYMHRKRRFLKKNHGIALDYASKDFGGLLEAYIELKGHPLCMDVGWESRNQSRVN